MVGDVTLHGRRSPTSYRFPLPPLWVAVRTLTFTHTLLPYVVIHVRCWTTPRLILIFTARLGSHFYAVYSRGSTPHTRFTFTDFTWITRVYSRSLRSPQLPHRFPVYTTPTYHTSTRWWTRFCLHHTFTPTVTILPTLAFSCVVTVTYLPFIPHLYRF